MGKRQHFEVIPLPLILLPILFGNNEGGSLGEGKNLSRRSRGEGGRALHRPTFTITRKTPKTYHRHDFSWKGPNLASFWPSMACKAKNPEQTEKTRRKSVHFFCADPPVFLPNRPKKGPFLLSVRFLARGHGWLWP
jgi:hypothetical protein